MARPPANSPCPLGASRLPAKNLRDGALQELVAEYPSHQFVIDRDEARESFFKNVASPEPAEQLLVDALGELAYRPLDAVRFRRYTPRGRRQKEEIVDIKIRKRTRSVREIEIEIMNETSEYLIRRGEAMQGTRRTRPNENHRPSGPGSRESIEAFLKAASLKGAPG